MLNEQNQLEQTQIKILVYFYIQEMKTQSAVFIRRLLYIQALQFINKMNCHTSINGKCDEKTWL